MNKIVTPEHSTYQINKDCTIKIRNDKTFTIILPEGIVTLQPMEVKDLHRITSAYKATHGNLWEQKQRPIDCLKCKYVREIPNAFTCGTNLTKTYICLKSKHEDKEKFGYCKDYEEVQEE